MPPLVFFVFFAFFADLVLPKPTKNLIEIEHYGNKIFGIPSLAIGEKVGEWSEKSIVNPEELGGYLEGDILIPQHLKNGLVAFSAKWDAGIVPYVIVGPYTSKDEDMIHEAIKQYHENTCIRFRRKQPDDVDYVKIMNTRTGCWSSVGKIGGPQELNLQSPGCLTTLGTPVHEIMHAIGFHHEQTRYERDNYVDIKWSNIKKGHENNFEKVPKDSTNGFGVKYDYDSVMHYSAYAFSANQQPTIVTKKDAKIGQRKGFSVGDIRKIRNMYNCTARDQNTSTGTNPISSIISGFQNFINTIG